MFILGTIDYPTQQQHLKGTLWHCAKCESFVSIHCLKIPYEAHCPVCSKSELEFCGSFDSLLGQQFADA